LIDELRRHFGIVEMRFGKRTGGGHDGQGQDHDDRDSDIGYLANDFTKWA
jgi:hypothetical protein